MNGTTITFPVQQVNETETIQLILNIYHDEVSGMRQWASDDYRIKIASWGDIKMDYNLEDTLLLPTNVNFEIDDFGGYMRELLFGQSTLSLSAEKEFEVKIKINGVEKVKGTAIAGTIRGNMGNKKIKFTMGTRTDILNKKQAFFEGGSHTFRVTSFTNYPSEGDVYSNNSSQFTVVGVLQIGTELRIATNRTSGTNNPLSADWLTKVSGIGDASYQYASWWSGYGVNSYNYGYNTYRSITSILEDIYKQVDSSISYSGGSLEIIHSWEMWGHRQSNECKLNNIRLVETFQRVNPLFFDEDNEISSMSDILRKLAIDWGAFTGMLSNGKAFFKQLFTFNESNTQTVKVKKWECGYESPLIEYVRVRTFISSPFEPYTKGEYTLNKDFVLERKSLPGFYMASGSAGTNILASISRQNHFVFNHGTTISNPPSEGSVYSNNDSQFKVIGTVQFGSGFNVTNRITTIRVSGSNNPEASGTLTKVSGTGESSYTYSSYGDANGTYEVYRARDPILDYPSYQNVFKDHGDLMSAFWYHNRNTMEKCRIDSFELFGIGYDFLKDFIHEGLKYQILSMTISPSQSLTDVKALFLGAE